MLKTICLYRFSPPIFNSILIFLFVKRGDNQNLSSGKASQFVSGVSSASLIGTLQ